MTQVHADDVTLGEQDAIVYRVRIALGDDTLVEDGNDAVDNLQMVIRSVVDNNVAHLEAVVVVVCVYEAITVSGDFRLHRTGLDGTEAQTGHQEEAEDNQKDKNGGRYGPEKFSGWTFGGCRTTFRRRGSCIRLLRHVVPPPFFGWMICTTL